MKLLLAILVLLPLTATAESYRNFESHQFRPLAISPDGSRLFVTNTPDNRVEVFRITDDGLQPDGSVLVGLEPVAVAARSDDEIWVVNHLSDSVSVVDVGVSPPRIKATLLVGDEPRDIVFAGERNERAYVTTAHRGQNSPYIDPRNPGELTTPGRGRADVWIIDALRRAPHPTHTHLEQTLNWIERVAPKQAVLTNMHIDLDYETVAAETPDHVVPAYDGMRITIELGD